MRSVVRTGIVLAGLITTLMVVPVRAATPSSGSLSPTHGRVAWSGSAMEGSAAVLLRYTCLAEPTACDDFRLTLSGAGPTDQLDIKLAPDPRSTMQLDLYPPSCPYSPTANCYSLYGEEAKLTGPQNGLYLVRVACTICPTVGSYDATATLRIAPRDKIPAPGIQTFDWKAEQLPPFPDGSYPFFGEPGIAINERGHAIINTFGPTVWISKDDGATWSRPQVVDPVCGSLPGDADAVVSFDDVFYADNLCLVGPSDQSYTSRDGGATWSGPGLPPPGPVNVDRSWYQVDPKTPGVVYMSYHDLEGPNITLWKSTDYGHTWAHLPSLVTLGASNFLAGVGNTTARPVVDPIDPDIITIIYGSTGVAKGLTASPTRRDLDLNQIYMARSTDGGMTWTNKQIYNAGQTNGQDNTIAHLFAATAIDTAGNVYVVFSERLGRTTPTHIMFAAIPRGSSAPIHPVQVDRGTGSNVLPWVAAGSAGRVDITWYGSPSQDADDPSSQWSEIFAQTVNGLSRKPTFTQSRVSGSRSVHNADVCLAGTLCLVTGGNQNLQDFQGVAVDPCGMAEAVWTDDSSSQPLTVVGRQLGGTSVYKPNPCVRKR